MLLFYRLLLGHVLADYVLQPKIIEQLKAKSILGVLFHGSIFLAVCIILCLPYLKITSFLIFLTLLTLSHVIIDAVRIRMVTRETFLSGAVDQFLHIALTAVVIPLSANYPTLKISIPYLANFYNQPSYTLYAIGFLAATYVAGYLVGFAKQTLVYEKKLVTLTLPDFIERGAITLLIFLGPPAVFFIPLVILLKLLYYIGSKELSQSYFAIPKQANFLTLQKVKIKETLGIELIASPTLAIFCGLAIKGLLI